MRRIALDHLLLSVGCAYLVYRSVSGGAWWSLAFWSVLLVVNLWYTVAGRRDLD